MHALRFQVHSLNKREDVPGLLEQAAVNAATHSAAPQRKYIRRDMGTWST